MSFFKPKKPELTADQKRRLPPGQVLTEKWPVLHASYIPRFDPKTWDFRISGLVEQPLRWSWQEFNALPMTTVHCDIHCVTRWSKYDNDFEGVHINEIMQHVKPLTDAHFVMEHADPDYTTNIPLDELVDDDVILALKHNGQPLTPEHGGPLRLVVPKLYFWKSAKWLRGFEFMPQDAPGFWEMYGYHMHGDPWRSERFGSPGDTLKSVRQAAGYDPEPKSTQRREG
jgi:DMSO/TMAO reductase YedYZ molybdopterin-dependent catalytic subunit